MFNRQAHTGAGGIYQQLECLILKNTQFFVEFRPKQLTIDKFWIYGIIVISDFVRTPRPLWGLKKDAECA